MNICWYQTATCKKLTGSSWQPRTKIAQVLQVRDRKRAQGGKQRNVNWTGHLSLFQYSASDSSTEIYIFFQQINLILKDGTSNSVPFQSLDTCWSSREVSNKHSCSWCQIFHKFGKYVSKPIHSMLLDTTLRKTNCFWLYLKGQRSNPILIN